ncbi:hypothetical protein EJ05DRAFT_474871 [Pseudovirgaria hyperparasitica]|uniref:Hyaluronan/mRNA-binding protein domain-containing protein n=1 Tax=Pseudovirgaria hyperparasitica TaxID=470096 RepID=A0A6A6WCN6_9PEZI|nr:uncharacterized protein EJ05DRAFT_474871 [Pseudovirgaria hyperparasitica]KAF2759814.1 hypothetical protein EJ05DRAFT_474871 [Pseudovirgaria hyperparasitica]
MTRSHKANDRDHAGIADGTADHEDCMPRYFAKSGHADSDPNKTKKNGGGKGNWGREGDELEDFNYNMTHPRRRTNSSSHGHDLSAFKTKFETIEAEPVFEEELHGPTAEDLDALALEKATTASTLASTGSVEEEDAVKKD